LGAEYSITHPFLRRPAVPVAQVKPFDYQVLGAIMKVF
jgi:hypothetical protein